MTHNPSVQACELPALSVLRMLDPDFVRLAYFQDGYRTRLRRSSAGPVDIFQSVFSHYPTWMKVVLIARKRLASLAGLEAPTASEIMTPEMKSLYSVGEQIGPWPIYALSGSELIAGRDNSHLDFRLSVLRETNGESVSAVISTVCRVHNTFGKAYLFFVIPFHKWGVRRLIKSAVTAGRL